MHDRIFKGLLRAFLPDLLRLVVPQAAEQLDRSCPVFVDKELFTDWLEGTRRELDLLASLPLRSGEQEQLLVHVEIEARATGGMAKRLRSYRSQIEARHNCWAACGRSSPRDLNDVQRRPLVNCVESSHLQDLTPEEAAESWPGRLSAASTRIRRSVPWR